MSSGWGCQHLTKEGDDAEWCRLLKKTCDPGCQGCVLYGEFLFHAFYIFYIQLM